MIFHNPVTVTLAVTVDSELGRATCHHDLTSSRSRNRAVKLMSCSVVVADLNIPIPAQAGAA